MKAHSPSLICSTIIAATIALSPPSSPGRTAINHSLADSVVWIQFGIDWVMVDSLLTHKLETARFLFRYSDNFRHAKELQSQTSSYDAYCDTVSRILELPTASFKTNVYLYADSIEQSQCFKGWPALREGQAFSFVREIHANGLGALEHETVHVLVNDLIAYASSAFFAEGIAHYVECIRSDDVLQKSIRIAKKVLSEPWDEWANDSIGFWSTGQIESIIVTYPVSGLFVNYLIQRSGLRTFKEFYRRIRTEKSAEVAFPIVYGHPLSKAISEFKTTIASW